MTFAFLAQLLTQKPFGKVKWNGTYLLRAEVYRRNTVSQHVGAVSVLTRISKFLTKTNIYVPGSY